MSWDTFIHQGFERKADLSYAQKYLQTYTPTTEYADDLHIRYQIRNGIKYYTVCCGCGNSRMTVHEGGIRCQICGRFHSHDLYGIMRLKARKIARLGSGHIEIKPQPYARLGKVTQNKRTKGTG